MKLVAKLLTLAAVLVLFATAASVAPETVVAQMFFGAQRAPSIAVDRSDKLYLSSSTATAAAGQGRPHSQIFFTMSRDGGAKWDNLPLTRNLTRSPGEAFGSAIATNRAGTNRAYITYHDDSNGTTQAYLIRSKKKAKFRQPINITPHNGGAFWPRVAVDSNETINVVWGDMKDSPGRIIFVRSTDLGATFGDPVDVSKSTGVAFEPEIAIGPDDAINVVWQDNAGGPNAIMFSRSTDGGVSFSEPKRISRGSGAATEAAIAADASGRLSVVWVDQSSGNAEGFYSRSTDGGDSFSEPINVSNIRDGDIHKVSVVTFEDIVYVAFQNGGVFGGDIRNMQVFLARSNNAGVSFGAAQQVSHANNNVGRAHSPTIAVDSRGVLHIGWIDASIVGNDEGLLFYCNTTNGTQFTQQISILSVL